MKSEREKLQNSQEIDINGGKWFSFQYGILLLHKSYAFLI